MVARTKKLKPAFCFVLPFCIWQNCQHRMVEDEWKKRNVEGLCQHKLEFYFINFRTTTKRAPRHTCRLGAKNREITDERWVWRRPKKEGIEYASTFSSGSDDDDAEALYDFFPFFFFFFFFSSFRTCKHVLIRRPWHTSCT